MKYLLILNDPPYGTEKSYNGLRLAMSLCKQEDVELCVFLLADSVGCAKAVQKTPSGYYNLERMIKSLAQNKALVGACESCMNARGIMETELTEGVRKSSMDELTDWTIWADKVVVF
jgi:uncharacterized protein involved in oxidation of intracellular sulfur